MSWIEYKGFEEGQFKFAPWVWCLIILYFSIPVLFYMVLPSLWSSYTTRLQINDTQAVVCVLGDLGHSPRMSYHTKSLCQHGFNVKLCGYMESELSLDIADDESIDIYDIAVYQNTRQLPYLIFALLKVLHQLVSLTKLMFQVMDKSKFVIIQNPPSLPLLLIVVILKKFWYKNCKIIVDWHNLNYSILNMKFQNFNHPVVKLMKNYELILGKYANLNLTVTNEMGKFLHEEFGMDSRKIITLYDRAPAQFQPILNKLEKSNFINSNPDIFKLSNHHFTFNPDVDKILISSTSFTEDEDFNILIDALKLYDQEKQLSNLLLIITGKGPMREKFLHDVDQAQFSKIIINLVWVPIELYPKLLSVADLGVSLHTSSSGIDLPMKIVDLFGCGVPVITLGFKLIGELVDDGVNGVIVHNCIDLYNNLKLLLNNDESLGILKKGALLETANRWDDTWNSTLGRYIQS